MMTSASKTVPKEVSSTAIMEKSASSDPNLRSVTSNDTSSFVNRSWKLKVFSNFMGEMPKLKRSEQGAPGKVANTTKTEEAIHTTVSGRVRATLVKPLSTVTDEAHIDSIRDIIGSGATKDKSAKQAPYMPSEKPFMNKMDNKNMTSTKIIIGSGVAKSSALTSLQKHHTQLERSARGVNQPRRTSQGTKISMPNISPDHKTFKADNAKRSCLETTLDMNMIIQEMKVDIPAPISPLKEPKPSNSATKDSASVAGITNTKAIKGNSLKKAASRRTSTEISNSANAFLVAEAAGDAASIAGVKNSKTIKNSSRSVTNLKHKASSEQPFTELNANTSLAAEDGTSLVSKSSSLKVPADKKIATHLPSDHVRANTKRIAHSSKPSASMPPPKRARFEKGQQNFTSDNKGEKQSKVENKIVLPALKSNFQSGVRSSKQAVSHFDGKWYGSRSLPSNLDFTRAPMVRPGLYGFDEMFSGFNF